MLRDEEVMVSQTWLKVEIDEGENLAKRVSLLMVLKPMLRMKCMKVIPLLSGCDF